MADRITVSGDAVVQEDDSTGDITIHVDQGTVSQAATEPDEIPRFDQLGGGGGFWEEDSNSPVSATSTTTVDYPMGGSYDTVLCEYQTTDTDFVDVRFNGDTGNNYTYSNSSGTTSTGNDRVPGINLCEFGATGTGVLLFGEHQDGIKCTPVDRHGASGVPTGSDNTNVAHPLTQINFLSSSSGDWQVRVYGRTF